MGELKTRHLFPTLSTPKRGSHGYGARWPWASAVLLENPGPVLDGERLMGTRRHTSSRAELTLPSLSAAELIWAVIAVTCRHP